MAHEWVVAEKAIFDRRLKEPALFAKTNKNIKSNLMWSSKLHKRDLVELLVALNTASAITTTDGCHVSFKTLVSKFSEFLNITISKPYDEREAILSRPPKVTDFLARLRKMY